MFNAGSKVMKLVSKSLVLFAFVLFAAASLFAQTTSSLTGTVTTEGAPLPGATVTVNSPSLLSTRTTVTGGSGGYSFGALPPGSYSVTFELAGLQTVTRQVQLKLSETSRSDADLKVTSVAESITVTASASSVLETTQISTNFDAKFIENLPIGRTITQRLLLAPGVQSSGPNNQTVIHGAQSFDNLYLVNGVVINENLRGTPQSAFIEDAIQETTILAGGVSAEYGRFTGGVVNTLTKSGGNEFSGSLRDNLTNDKWVNLTDFVGEVPHIDKLNHTYEGTLGGRIIRDRLWFFGAGRLESNDETRQTTATNISYVRGFEESRYEAKLTGQITPRHTLVGSYTDVIATETNNRFGNVVDLASLSNRELPLTLSVVHYNGVFGTNFLAEAQWSAKDFAFVGGGATARDRINGTLVRDFEDARRAHSPTFCGVCPDKERNNKDFQVKGTYFLSTKSFGSHNIIIGIDDFHELRREDNYQSGSDFRVFGIFVYSGKDVFLSIVPTVPGGSVQSRIEWDPVLNSSKTSDFATRSLFVNDKWDLNKNFSFSLGARYDKNDGKDQAGNKTADDSRISPRFGVIYDPAGNGRNKLSATYGRYVAKLDQGPADSSSNAGRPAYYYYEYRGPAFNTRDASGKIIGTPVSTADVLRGVFAWFDSVGGTNATNLIYDQGIPGLTERIVDGVKSPYMDEITAGYGFQIGSNGFVRADIINRNWSDFYVTTRNLQTGSVIAPSGAKVDVGFIGNSNEGLERKYNAAQVQANYRLFNRINFGGNYTYSRLRGNVEGETFNNATVTVGNEQYPEYRKFDRNQPIGNLSADQTHRANLWAQVEVPIFYGDLNVSALQRFRSGQAYSAVGTIDVRDGASRLPNGIVNPGYATPPTSVPYFFSDRGEFRLDDISTTDFNLNYSFPISRLNLFVKADLLNAFDQQGVENVATGLGSVIQLTVRTRRNVTTGTFANPGGTPAKAVAFNPFTGSAPRQFIPGKSDPLDPAGYNYVLDPRFGQPTNKDAYQQPRTYRFAVGLRF